jgi:tricarballylate dehydrogenase
MRVAYGNLDELLELLPDLSQSDIDRSDFGSYPEEQFLEDIARITQYRCDPDLVEILVNESRSTLRWMTTHGIRFVPIYGRQAYEVDGRFKFWGGLTIEVSGGGIGLVETLTKSLTSGGGEVIYGARAVDLHISDGAVGGVVYRTKGVDKLLEADAVVLACGGFESNTEWRARYLGPNWDLAKVRGTFYNTGDGLRMALDAGASPAGNWSGCHAVGWDRNAPEFGDREIGDQFEKHSYPFSIMVNADGRRFLDEGADFRNFTYAKYGRQILQQPGLFAWQVFDSQVTHLLRPEYKIRQVTKVVANSIEELAQRLDDVDPEAFLETVREFNGAVKRDVPFDPNSKDGRGTTGLAIPKSNWANAIEKPPFEAYAVTCGVTFTFGGVRINTNAQVLSTDLDPIPGLFAAGEIVGGIFYSNYPGGSGLTNGAVFGRIAGRSAGRAAGQAPS